MVPPSERTKESKRNVIYFELGQSLNKEEVFTCHGDRKGHSELQSENNKEGNAGKVARVLLARLEQSENNRPACIQNGNAGELTSIILAPHS